MESRPLPDIEKDADLHSGAASSKGRTSWSAKSEADDYISFAGFMAVFMHHLNLRSAYSDPEVFDSETYELATIPSHTPTDPFTSSTISPANLFHATRDLGSSTADNLPERPLLILAGYSYGSLVTTLLPPLPTLLIPFQSPNHGSTASEIRLRAQHLAESQNALHTARVRHASETRSRRRLAASRNLTTGMRVGGEETSPDVRRASHEAHRGRRSLGLDRLEHSEWGRRSIDRVRSLRRSMDGSRLRSLSPSRASHHASHSKKSRSSSSFAEDRRAVVAGSKEEASTDSATVDPTMKANMPMPSLEFGELDVAYLLISPIQGVIGGLATMFSTTPASALLPSLPFSHRKRSHCEPTAHGARERKFVGNKTLVMFGDKDGFSNVERMRRWTQRLEGVQGSKLSAVEVKDGGHFWHSERELELLKSRVRQWVAELEYE